MFNLKQIFLGELKKLFLVGHINQMFSAFPTCLISFPFPGTGACEVACCSAYNKYILKSNFCFIDIFVEKMVEVLFITSQWMGYFITLWRLMLSHLFEAKVIIYVWVLIAGESSRNWRILGLLIPATKVYFACNTLEK